MIQRLICAGLILIVLAAPLAFRLDLYRGGDLLIRTKMPAAEMLIWVVSGLWLVEILSTRSFARIQRPPAPLLAFLMVAVLSTIAAPNRLDAVKETVQLADGFLLGYALFMNHVTSTRLLERVVVAFLIAAAAVVAYGVAQSVAVGREHAHLVHSSFDDRHVFAGYMVITLPVLFGIALGRGRRKLRSAALLTVVAGLLVMPSAFAFAITIGALAFVAVACGRGLILTSVVLVAGIVIPFVPLGTAPREFVLAKRAFVEPDGIENYHASLRRSAEMIYMPRVGGVQFGDFSAEIYSSAAITRRVPDEFVAALVGARRRDDLYQGGHVKQRFLEWQAAIHLLRDHPALGVGPGGYQASIGPYYRSFPKLNTMEPSTQNGYLVLATTMGFAGLGALMWTLVHHARASRRKLRAEDEGVERSLAAGLTGSLMGFAVCNMLTPLLHQSTVIPFVIVISLLAVNTCRPEPEQ